MLPLLVPEVPLWLLPDEEDLCFLLFLWVPLLPDVLLPWLPDCDPVAPCSVPLVWPLAPWPEVPEVLPDCAWTFTELNIAATTDAPSSTFNTLFVFMSISCLFRGKNLNKIWR
jgi:hypothetical protein